MKNQFASNTNCEAVLLSPACASFEMFDNFEHRGRVFKEERKTKY
jgi:UDP-N-acetylmuramoylalanine--D-glutamate ligase